MNRKINIGNFENIDVYAAIIMSLDEQTFSDAVKDAALSSFSLVSKETGERYEFIKKGF